MNTEAFTRAYNESRNGANQFFRHPLARLFLYSDGVKECADAGCYWLLDILATELPRAFRSRPQFTDMCIVAVTVKDESAKIVGEFEDDDAKPYRRTVDYTDMPAGEWLFYVSNDGDGHLRCILPKEY